jgi:hypothetical protein
MDVDGIIDSELHEEGRKQAAWEKAYEAALARWDDLTDGERQAALDDWITNNDGVPLIARALAKYDQSWRDRAAELAEDIDFKASDAWATEQARKSLENTEGE